MKLADILNKGPQRVRHAEGVEFMLSVRSGYAGVIGIAPFALGGKCPRLGKHRMLPCFAREQYFEQLEIVL